MTKHPIPAGIRHLRLCAATIFATAAMGCGVMAQSRLATLQAIHCLENPGDCSKPGPCGELGAYQFRAATWHRYSQQPFYCALDRRASDDVATRHYEWLKQQIERRGLLATPYNIALAWNGGLGAVFCRRPPRAARDYAQRAANLAADFDRPTASR